MKKKAKQCAWGDHIYRAAPSKTREGWVASACVKCGKFLGRMPVEDFSCSPSSDAPGGRYAPDQATYTPQWKPSKRTRRKLW